MIVVVAIVAVAEAFIRSDEPNHPAAAPAVAAAAALLLILPLLARHRSPFLAPAWLWLLAAALSFLDGRLIVSSASVYAAGLVAAFLIGSLPDERQGRIGLAIVGGSAAIIALNDPLYELSEILLVPAIFVLAWLGGFAQRERAAQVLHAEERARHAESQREAAARLAVAEERARIAREVHDTVAHAVSVMVLQVGAVRHRLPPGDFAEDVEALRGVEATGRSALGEMRHLVGAMRRGDDGPELSPQPGLGRLDALLEEIRRAGLPVELHVAGEPAELPAAIDLSAYRIVQEGLTNALKHARATQARVEIHYAADELRIEVSDDGEAGADAGGNGHGLVGIGERVKLYGGEMTSGAAAGGGFRLTTSLPLSGYGVMIRVLVADDQSMIRAGFRLLLAREPDIEVIAEARNGVEAVQQAARFSPTVVLMDIRMPELDGIHATRQILAADAAARILILTTFDLDEYVYEALQAGASGFVLKDDPPEQLIAALRTVAAGDALLSPAVTRRVIQKFTQLPKPVAPEVVSELTARELEIFRLIAEGLSNGEISERLFIGDTTVKTHVTHILQKLGLRDRVQAVVLAYQTGLFEP